VAVEVNLGAQQCRRRAPPVAEPELLVVEVEVRSAGTRRYSP
jgi:hypothetical protein